MTKESKSAPPPNANANANASSKRRITIERTYKAPVEDVWDLWTTKDGIESWWGPEGFVVTVSRLDLRPGGQLAYTMTASAPEQIAFMKQAGMPLSNQQLCTYTEIASHRRLAYESLADFIPGVEPYVVATLVELFPSDAGVRMVLSFDAMHDEQWTKMAVMGHESQLRKLEKVLGS